MLAEIISDDPVNDNDGSVISCGNQNWCCQPGAAAGTCNCASGDGTFSLQDGLAQTIIGIQGLGNTNTDVIPISSASTPPTTASSSAMTTSSTPSQSGATEAEPTTSSSLGYGTSLSASAASKTSSPSSSSSSPSGQSILTVTIQPTIITMMPTSGISTTSGSNSPTASAVSSIGVPHSTAFKIGLSVGLITFAVAVVCLCIFLCLRRQRRRARRGDFIGRNVPSPPSAAQHGSSDTGDTAQDFEYRTLWPPLNGAPESLANRSGYELHPLVPDHDRDRRIQPPLSGPPAADPYAVPPHGPDVRREASPLQRGPGAASPLDYRPTMRGANRPRGNAYRTLPRAPQAWMSEVPEISQDWPPGEQR